MNVSHLDEGTLATPIQDCFEINVNVWSYNWKTSFNRCRELTDWMFYILHYLGKIHLLLGDNIKHQTNIPFVDERRGVCLGKVWVMGLRWVQLGKEHYTQSETEGWVNFFWKIDFSFFYVSLRWVEQNLY